ncbi:hypothetical protein Tco_1463109 [Tanacetum coccineum]
MAVPKMPYEQLAEFLEEKCGYYFQGLYYQVPNQDVERGLVRVSDDGSTFYMFDVEETRRCTVEVDSETEYESDDDSDYQSDKSVDYLSPGEDELIELRNRMKANRKAKAKANDKPDEEMNEPNEENSMPVDNVRGETFEEHDI